MGLNSSIEWTTHTFNPWWGCTKVSDGCRHCYAETLSNRYGHNVWGAGQPRRLMSDNHWREPVKWDTAAAAAGTRAQVFCASMADVFDPEAPSGQRDRLWNIIRETPHLDWQVLTKRPELIRINLPADWGNGWHNVWLGTSVEDHRVVNRIGHLVEVPAVVRFLSLEPLIGPLTNLPLAGIDWAIVGGESGPGSRPMDVEWVRDIHQQCQAAHVRFFFKQWGGVRKKAAGRELDGNYYNEMPQPQTDRVRRLKQRGAARALATA